MGATVATATIMLSLHIVSAVVWVGGMFFALLVLRPATGPLQPPVRLELWSRVLGRFFAWVFVAILLLLLSGYWVIFAVFSGFRGAGLHIHIMMGLGIVMILIFLHLYFAPWRRFQAAITRQDYAAAAAQLGQIRWIVTANLVLGLINAAIGGSGRYWG
jgi:uncharacterized membrane protein